MNEQQYNSFRNEGATPRQMPSVGDLVDRTPRTLIYGYDVNRVSFHVYLGYDQLIHIVYYAGVARGSNRGLIISHTYGESGCINDPKLFVPNKRVYPESCDLEFCKLLRTYGISIPFTTFTEGDDEKRRRKHGIYAGVIYADEIDSVDLSGHFKNNEAYLELSLTTDIDASRLVAQAAIEINAVYAETQSKEVFVEKEKANQVLNHAQALLKEAHTRLFVNVSGVDDGSPYLIPALTETLFPDNSVDDFEELRDYSSAGTVSITARLTHEPTILVDIKPEWKQYTSKEDDAFWINGVTGEVRGRPFVFAVNKHGAAEIRYSEFGNCEEFLQKQLSWFKFNEEVAVG